MGSWNLPDNPIPHNSIDIGSANGSWLHPNNMVQNVMDQFLE